MTWPDHLWWWELAPHEQPEKMPKDRGLLWKKGTDKTRKTFKRDFRTMTYSGGCKKKKMKRAPAACSGALAYRKPFMIPNPFLACRATYCAMKGFIVFPLLEGHPRSTSSFFLHQKCTKDCALSQFLDWKATVEGTSSCFVYHGVSKKARFLWT